MIGRRGGRKVAGTKPEDGRAIDLLTKMVCPDNALQYARYHLKTHTQQLYMFDISFAWFNHKDEANSWINYEKNL